MSGAGDPDDTPDLRAAEYVLGVLDPAERLAFEAELARDPALLDAVARWEGWLAPLALAVAPEVPPASLWTRLQLATGVRDAEPRRPALVRLWRSAAVWRTTTAAAAALAASLAFVALRPGIPKVAVLLPVGAPEQPAFVLRATARGNGRIEPLNPAAAAVQAGRSLELWAQGPSEAAPHSVGLVPPTGRSGFFPAPPGTRVLISSEPAGGSPTGQPTGPVLYAGTLR